MNFKYQDIIAAIATPLGQGGIGIVRLSGPGCKYIGNSIFRASRKNFQDFKPYVLHHGWISDQDQTLDEVLVSFMPAPATYTGEDVLEINCHGGPAVVQAVLELVINQGARLAEPGEFTLRAFLNGRIDLTQAESIGEIINAPTRTGLQMAGTKLQGQLGQKIQELRNDLEAFRARLCVNVDFPEEEDGETLDPETIKLRIQEIAEKINQLLDNYKRYSCWREGALVVLAGQVNAGKSSLLNAMLGRNRAIVTSIPGTTRDYLEENLNLNGLPVKLVDTAGLREAWDTIEQAGLEQGKTLVQEADLVCLVFDLSDPEDLEVTRIAEQLSSKKILAVANKSDLPKKSQHIMNWFLSHGYSCISVSAKQGHNLKLLMDEIKNKIVGQEKEPRQGELIPNIRQKNNLTLALQELDKMENSLNQGFPIDLLDIHLENASNYLAEITGKIQSEDILDQIFSNFCIGK